MAGQVFDITGTNPLLDIALELERIALEDEYFVSASCIRTSTSTAG
jgi:citrate synthase